MSGADDRREQNVRQPMQVTSVASQPVAVTQPVAVVKVVPVADSALPAKIAEIAQKEPLSKDKNKPAAKLNKKHVVQPGESLQSIAKKYYNDAKRWKEIYKANKDKVVGGQVSPGQELLIP